MAAATSAAVRPELRAEKFLELYHADIVTKDSSASERVRGEDQGAGSWEQGAGSWEQAAGR